MLVSSQDCPLTLRGYVKDASTGFAIEYANILLEESRQGVVSDAAGYFELAGVCPGRYHISVSHIGCETQRLYVAISSDTTLAVQLDHYSQVLDRVTVTGTAGPATTQSGQSLNEQKISQSANLNIASLLESLPGVSVLRTGGGIGKPVVHGLYGNRLMILNNGVAQSGQQWGNDHSPEIDPLAANKITVLKGVGALEYQGSTLGSVVLVEPGNISPEPHLHGKAHYYFETNGRGHGTHLQLEKGGRQLAWAVKGTLKQNGDRHSARYFLRNTGGREANLALHLERTHTEHWKTKLYLSTFNTRLGVMRGAHIGNVTDLQSALEREVPFFTEPDFTYRIDAPRQEVSHHLLKLHTRYEGHGQQWLDFTYAAQLNDRKEYDVRRGGRSDRPALSLVQWSHFWEAKLQHYFRNGLKLKTGTQFNIIDNTNSPGTGILPLIPDYLALETGFFAMLSKQQGKVLLEAGGRYDYQRQAVATVSAGPPKEVVRYDNRFHNVSATGGLSYAPSTAAKWSLNLGAATRNPAVNELYSGGLHQGVSGIEEGDVDLSRERSLKATLGVEGRIREQFFVEVLAYYQHIDDYIFLNPQQEVRLTIRGAFPVFRYEQTDARLYGADVSATWQPRPYFSAQLKYSYLRGHDLRQDIPLVNMPANNALATLSYQYPKLGALENLSAEWSHRWVSRQGHLLAWQDFAPPPPGYYLMGLRLSAQRPIQSARLTVYVRADNLLNNAYRDYLNRLRYFADDMGVNVLMGASLAF